jgi:hypothetical protein
MANRIIAAISVALAMALCEVGCSPSADAAPLLAQFQLAPSETIESRSPETQINSADRRRLFQDKIDRIRSHHRPTPITIEPVSFVQPRSATSVAPRSLRELTRTGAPIVVTKTVITASQITSPPINSRFISPIAEPSIAAQAKNMLVTYNWGAVWSNDGGKKFIQLDPYREFRNPLFGDEFCCDQTAIYSPEKELMVWLLQGDKAGGGNRIRLLTARGKEIGNRKWRAWDFRPGMLGLSNVWFDFPDIATTTDHLFISLNVFTSDENEAQGSIVLRIRLDQLAAAQRITFDRVVDPELFSVRFAQGPGGTMFWAAQQSNHSFTVGAWKDTASYPTANKLAEVEAWTVPDEVTTKGSEGPNKRPWLTRVDHRMHTGWTTEDNVGFAWTSGAVRDPSGFIFPYPHIRVAIFNRSELEGGERLTIQPIAQPHIFNNESAFAYPAAAVNATGEVGIAAFFGGGQFFPSAVVGRLRKDSNTWRPELVTVVAGTNTPRCARKDGMDATCGVWGDYLGVRPDPNDRNGWIVAMQTNADRPEEPAPRMALTVVRFRSASPVASRSQ